MGGAESFLRKGGVGRYLHIQMPLDLLTWSGGNGPEWLPSLLDHNETAPTAAGRGTLLHLQNAATNDRAPRRTAITMRIGAADVGVTIEKPTGLRELHVDADGIVLDGVNLTVACADFAASGLVSHAAVRDATLHAPLACASAEREGDAILTVAKAGAWGHIVFEDLVDIDSTVVISRPDHACTLHANAPFFVGGADVSACMAAVLETMRTPESGLEPSPPPPNSADGHGATTTVFMKMFVDGWDWDFIDDIAMNTSHRQLAAHAELDAPTLARVTKEVISAIAGVGLVIHEENVAIVASVVTEHTSSIGVTITIAEEVGFVLQKAVNETMRSSTFYMALGAIVLGDVYTVTVEFRTRPASMAESPASGTPPDSVWWNGKTGDWHDPSIWNGGDVNNASEVFICPPSHSNGTVFVRNGYTRANSLTLCNSSSDADTLVIEGDLCIGEECP